MMPESTKPLTEKNIDFSAATSLTCWPLADMAVILKFNFQSHFDK